MPTQLHPDGHELDDWAIYGPKNPEIAWLVEKLARSYDLRVRDIEDLIIQTLQDRLAAEEMQRR